MPLPPVQAPLNGSVSACGPTQTTISPDDLLQLILQMTPDECLQVTTKLGCISSASARNANNVWTSIYAQGVDALAVPLSKTVENSNIATEVEEVAGATETTFTVGPGAGGIGLLFTLAPAEVESFVGCDCGLFTLSIPSCDPTQDPQALMIPEHQLQTPGLPGSNYHQGNAFQAIVNLLVELRSQVQNFQSSVAYKLVATTSNQPNVVEVNPFSGDSIGVLKLQISANPDPARINWQPPDDTLNGGVQRFGKVIFTDAAGNASPVYFFNVNNQIFLPPFAAASATLYLNDGVEVVALYKTPAMCQAGQVAYEQSY